MNKLTNQDVQEFIELLVTLGDMNRLDANMIILDSDGNACTIRDGNTVKSIQILHNGMVKDENNFIFNPFKMIEGNNPAFNWFYNSRMLILSNIIRKIILKIVELSVSKETENYDVLQLLTNVSESCDKLTISELEEINALDYFRIFYNKKTKVAEAQTLIFSDEIESNHKLRKKTWTAVRNLMRNLFKLKEDESTLSAYNYHATILSIPELDAKLHVMFQVIELMDPWAKMIGYDLRVEDFRKHLENLESYVRMFAWFTAKATNDELVVSNQAPSGLPVRNDISTPPAPVVAAVPAMPAISTPVMPAMGMSVPMPVATPGYGMMPEQTAQLVNPFQPTMPPMMQPTMSVPMQPIMPTATPTMVNPFQVSVAPAPQPVYGVPQYSMMPQQTIMSTPQSPTKKPIINIK